MSSAIPLPARPQSDAAIAQACASDLRDAFADYNARFRAITQRAKRRFERREWTAARLDAIERIELYDVCVAETSRRLEAELGERVGDRGLWSQVRDRYAALIAPLLDQELNKTFFNTLTRRFFKTRGVDPASEFVALDIEPTDRLTHPVPRLNYTATRSPEELFQRVLAGFRFEVPYADIVLSAQRIAAAVDAQLPRWEGEPKVRAVEMLETVFYRERRAYLVGRVFGEREFAPLVIALFHEDQGLRADAVMVQRDDVAALFGITRSYFQADLQTVGDAVVFLRTLLPRKPVNEIYTVLGRAKQGKTERYRHFYRHFESSDEQLTLAEGEKGLVMAVFTLPSYPLVFKIIRDEFAPSKLMTRQDVVDKYQLVFKHDRAGRLIDAQEFRFLRFPRARFAPEVLEDLFDTCRSSVIEDGDHLVLTHMYVERRLRPLNLFLKESPPELVERAVLDYGLAIKELAASNIFPGDLLLKNFGVTRHGRVIFYDYDELCLVTECQFRELPKPRDDDEEMHHGAWYYVGDDDVFPEQFTEFLGLPRRLREALIARHGEIFNVQWWHATQAKLNAGQFFDIPPYREEVRLLR
ncbi:MAG: bifunctional isocitrate dehydrogenase kinase/phosphatase [Xanthomonadales bacterium]|nr:Isocitrate dehydrogenase kinase/phosphatase [Xanthomonadales bacterium]MCC6593622.1 bifunctional isocitrate dehydrogenase kinase/phosphatase [Xanthomonadales bacterium]MCE7930340.1 bifunctional isocitrate dehydrogenase kinase/phosphatase [Xanthomonadales bacterium PRO6]